MPPHRPAKPIATASLIGLIVLLAGVAQAQQSGGPVSPGTPAAAAETAAPEKVVWDTAQRCFRTVSAERCGLRWHVGNRRFAGQTLPASVAEAANDAQTAATEQRFGLSERARDGALSGAIDRQIAAQLETSVGAILDAYSLGQADGLGRAAEAITATGSENALQSLLDGLVTEE